MRLFNIFLLFTSVFITSSNSKIVGHNFINSENDLYIRETARVLEVAKAHPNNIKSFNMGVSFQKKNVTGIVISDNVTSEEEDKIKVNLIGVSTAAFEFLLQLTLYINENIGNDETIDKILKDTIIYIVPSVNPDKLNLNCDRESVNSNDVDIMKELNLMITNSNTIETKDLQPETIALFNFFNNHNFDIMAAFDSGNLSIYTSPLRNQTYEDYTLSQEVVNMYKESHNQMVMNGACNFLNSTSNGNNDIDNFNNNNNLNNVNNVLVDCNQAFHTSLAFRISIFCCDQLNSYSTFNVFKLNEQPTISLLKRSLTVIKGNVLDEVTKQPIPGALIKIHQIMLISDVNGKFKKLLPSGFYTIEVFARNYEKVILNGIYIASNNPTRIDLYAKPLISEKQSNLSKLLQVTNEMKVWSNIVEDIDDLHHMNYEEMTKTLNETTNQCHDVMRLYSIGQSVQGRNLWVVEVSKTLGIRRPGIPTFKYIGNMHGNEVISRVLLIYFIKLLCANHLKSRFVNSLIEHTSIHILPSMNPDGYEISQEGDADSSLGRANAHDVDLNRNFPKRFPNIDDKTNATEVETRSVMDWSLSMDFVLSANLHGGTLVANYPYDDSPYGTRVYTKSPDDITFRMLASSYAQAHPYMHLRPQCGLSNDAFDGGITNGAAWYSVSGGMQDWNYLHTNCFELTLEVSCDKFPYEAELRKYWDDNKESLFDFLAQVHKGIRGYTVDMYTGAPIADVMIFVDDIKHDVTSTRFGEFWRLLSPGRYKVTAAKLNYASVTRVVEVSNGASTFILFQMLDIGLTAWPQVWSIENDYNITDNLQRDYLTIDQIYLETENLVEKMDSWVQITSIGDHNKALRLVNVSSNRGPHTKKNILVLTQLDGEERIGGEVIMRLLRHLVYSINSSDASISSLLMTHHLKLIPIVRMSHHNGREVNEGGVEDDGRCRGDKVTMDTSLEFRDDGMEMGDGRVDILKKMLATEAIDVIVSLETGYVDVLSTKDDNLVELIQLNVSRSYISPMVCNNNNQQPPRTITNLHSLHNYVKRHFNNISMFSIGLHCCREPSAVEIVNVYARTLRPLLNILFFNPEQQPPPMQEGGHWSMTQFMNDGGGDIGDDVHDQQPGGGGGDENQHNKIPSSPPPSSSSSPPSSSSSSSLPVIIGSCSLAAIVSIIFLVAIWKWKQHKLSPWRPIRLNDDEYEDGDEDNDADDGFKIIKLNEYNVKCSKSDESALVRLNPSSDTNRATMDIPSNKAINNDIINSGNNNDDGAFN